MVENNGNEIAENNENLGHNETTNLNTESSSLPVNCLPLTHQVAGHFFGKGRTKLGT